MYNFKIAQLHIQGCEEGLFFLNHSSCNSPMVGKIFLGGGGAEKLGQGRACLLFVISMAVAGLKTVFSSWFFWSIWSRHCDFTKDLECLTTYIFFSRNTKIIHSRKSDQGNTSNKSFQNGPKDESNNTLEIIQKPCFLNVFSEATFQILLHSNKITATAL